MFPVVDTLRGLDALRPLQLTTNRVWEEDCLRKIKVVNNNSSAMDLLWQYGSDPLQDPLAVQVLVELPINW